MKQWYGTAFLVAYNAKISLRTHTYTQLHARTTMQCMCVCVILKFAPQLSRDSDPKTHISINLSSDEAQVLQTSQGNHMQRIFL